MFIINVTSKNEKIDTNYLIIFINVVLVEIKNIWAKIKKNKSVIQELTKWKMYLGNCFKNAHV